MLYSGFDSTFEKWFLSFQTKITAKVILSVAQRGWMVKNIFHSRLPKTVLNRIFQSSCFTEKHQICVYQKTFPRKIILLKNFIKQCSISLPAIKLVVGIMVELLHKEVFRNHGTQTATWVYLKRQLK